MEERFKEAEKKGEFTDTDYGCEGRSEQCCGACGGDRINTEGIKRFIYIEKNISYKHCNETWIKAIDKTLKKYNNGFEGGEDCITQDFVKDLYKELKINPNDSTQTP